MKKFKDMFEDTEEEIITRLNDKIDALKQQLSVSKEPNIVQASIDALKRELGNLREL